MRKVPSKRSFAKLPLSQLPQKPYGFCCEEKAQDPEKRYDMRNPPFASSLTAVVLGNGGPGTKFRVQDIGLPPYSIQRRILEAKGRPYLGRCRRCRGPLRWYLEDEIARARELLAKERQDTYNASSERNLRIAKRKARKRSKRMRKRNLKITSEITRDNRQFEKQYVNTDGS